MADTSRPMPARPPPSSEPSPLKTRYLTLYNLLSAVLWLTVFGRTVLLVPLVGYPNIYGGVGEFVKWTQTLAVMEILHSALGIVRAPLPTTLLQVSSRLFLIWAVVGSFPATTTHTPAYPLMLLAWSATEVVRYGYFAIALGFGSARRVPGVVAWLRYNMFFVLYPLGIGSETWLVYQSLGPAGRMRYGGWFQLVLLAVLGIYVPGSYILYTHMMAQRRKVMKGKGREE